MMSDDLNLPASLERLEISADRCDGTGKTDQKSHLKKAMAIIGGGGGGDVPTAGGVCSLQTLSLKDDCPKGSCQCNKKKERETALKRVTFKRPILRRSKLNKTAAILRAPMLNVKEHASTCAKCAENAAAKVGTPVGSPLIAPNSVVSSDPSIRIDSSRLSGTMVLGNSAVGRFHPVTSSLCSVQARIADSYDSSSVSDTASTTATSITSPSIVTSTSVSVTEDDDDTTIDELASYFDLFVHIPKKMSLMAEMMYI